jgi:hypothetical protein
MWVFPVRRLAPDGLEAWAQVIERGYEDHVAKDEANVYEGRAIEAVAEGQAEGLAGRRGPLATAALRGATDSLIAASPWKGFCRYCAMAHSHLNSIERAGSARRVEPVPSHFTATSLTGPS